ncbi:MAG: diguanylate cyclase, partial [Eubacteriales bacterium]|nr:diguanylate cyclase [Eubacteriales bacterium]
AYLLTPEPENLLLLSMYKGWTYVGVTALIFYALIKKLLKKIELSESETAYLIFHDVLTEIYNRRFYETQVSLLDKEENLPISIILADINGLKVVNDALGHQIGDQILKRAAKAMQEVCRKNDVLARWGGDEFVLLLPKTTAEEAEVFINKIQENCISHSEEMLPVDMALGRATKNDKETSISEILKKAEDAMYKNKMVQSKGLRGNIINMILKTLYEKNPREEAHSERVGEIAAKIGAALGFSEIAVFQLQAIGRLHDIGKIGIAEGILNNPRRLNEIELEEVKRHPEAGYRILSATKEMTELADCVLSHHERWDGNGYPKGLSGVTIPIEARIIALADAYDAMSSERPYRKPLPPDAIYNEIKNNAGHQFDPAIAQVFLEKVINSL